MTIAEMNLTELWLAIGDEADVMEITKDYNEVEALLRVALRKIIEINREVEP